MSRQEEIFFADGIGFSGNFPEAVNCMKEILHDEQSFLLLHDCFKGSAQWNTCVLF